jgi:hypothetical protein
VSKKKARPFGRALRDENPTYFAGAFVGSTAGAAGAAFFFLVVVFFLVVDFFFVVVPEAVVFDSIELEDEVDVEEDAAGAGAAVGLGAAADWARRPVGRATATPIARMRARDLFISLSPFGAAQSAPPVRPRTVGGAA